MFFLTQLHPGDNQALRRDWSVRAIRSIECELKERKECAPRAARNLWLLRARRGPPISHVQHFCYTWIMETKR